MGVFLQSLLRAGDIAGWWDFRAGHTQDLSGNGNHGVINGNCVWEGDGLRLVDNTAYVEVAHHASLNFTDFTPVLLKPKQRNHELGSGGANSGWLSKYTGGAGTAWYAYLSAYRSRLFDGVNIRYTGQVYNDDERYLALSLTAGGGTAVGYRDGLSIGNFNGASTLPTNTHNIRIGWITAGIDYDGTIESVMLISRVLTAAEHAQLYDELVNLTWPAKTYGSAKRTQAVEKADPKLISGWNLKPAGGQVPDEITTRDLTTIHNMVSKPGILGEGMSGPDAGYLATANGVYSNADFSTNGLSVECWVRLADILGGAKGLFSINGLGGFYCNASVLSGYVWDSSPGSQTASSAAGALRANRIFHAVLTAEANGAVRLYIDGQLQPTVDTMLDFNINSAHPTVLGALHDFTAGVDADFFKPRIYDYELSQAEVSAKYLEGAKAIQFKTDWNFKVSPAAEGGMVGQIIGGVGSPLRAGDATFRGVVEVDTVNGRLCKVLRCTVAGAVYTSRELWFDCSPTEAAFGSFSGWMYKADASTLTWKFIGTDLNAAANGYAVVWAADESVVISELGVGNVIAGGVASHSTWHKFDQTHASDGDFDAYIDDTTFGNGSDLTITDSIGMLWGMGIGDKIALSNIQGDDGIVKRLGVCTP